MSTDPTMPRQPMMPTRGRVLLVPSVVVIALLCRCVPSVRTTKNPPCWSQRRVRGAVTAGRESGQSYAHTIATADADFTRFRSNRFRVATKTKDMAGRKEYRPAGNHVKVRADRHDRAHWSAMADESKPFHNPFAALERLRGTMRGTEAETGTGTGTPDLKVRRSEGQSDSDERPRSDERPGSDERPSAFRSAGRDPRSAGPSGPASHNGPARAVVRLERAGRGGKAVTVVEHLDLRGADLERWLKSLKSQLGCGGVIEGDAIVLQGDHRDRLPKLLADRGVKKVTRGS
jgi:translation initiation factor 1